MPSGTSIGNSIFLKFLEESNVGRGLGFSQDGIVLRLGRIQPDARNAEVEELGGEQFTRDLVI